MDLRTSEFNQDKDDYKSILDRKLKEFKDEHDALGTEGYENGRSVSNNRLLFPRGDYRLTKISSTLLIPEKYFEHFQKRIIQYHGVRAYIAHLLFQYRIHIANGIIPAYSNLTTKYQEKDQNLQRISFRPLAADWAELKLYRVSFGMSISAFIVYLVIADCSDFAWTVSHLLVAVGISTVPQFDLTSKVYLWNKRDYYSVVFQFRESSYG